MEHNLTLNDIVIRTELKPGDLGYITYLHGMLYKQEYKYGIAFEAYVAAGMSEFFQSYDPARSRIWVCEHGGKIVGSLFLLDRGSSAQLRYFLVLPAYRGIGLGKKLMELYMEFLERCGYKSSYLWTTDELHAAARLYGQFGFRLREEKASAAFGKPVIEQKHELVLKPSRG